MRELAAAVAQMLVLALAAPLVIGVTRTLKARLVGRRGPGIGQPYRDLAKLLGKEPVVSSTTSWIFRVTPYLLAAIMLAAALLVPALVTAPAPGLSGNAILLMSMFLLGTFFLALAGLDAGSAFGGMGGSRDVAVAALAEPTIILAILALGMRAETIELGGVVERLGREPMLALNPGHLLAFAAFFLVMLAETGRLPVDNPATHLELTMIHEAMVLEYSGRHLALIEWASAMKLLLFMTLLANLFLPWGVPTAVTTGSLGIGLLLLAGKLAGLCALLAVVETSVAKLRLFRVPELLSGSFALALVAVMAVFLIP